jgi:hypothetical protein
MEKVDPEETERLKAFLTMGQEQKRSSRQSE